MSAVWLDKRETQLVLRALFDAEQTAWARVSTGEHADQFDPTLAVHRAKAQQYAALRKTIEERSLGE